MGTVARNTLLGSIASWWPKLALSTRRGNPYDNARAKSFMKTLKVECVYPMA